MSDEYDDGHDDTWTPEMQAWSDNLSLEWTSVPNGPPPESQVTYILMPYEDGGSSTLEPLPSPNKLG